VEKEILAGGLSKTLGNRARGSCAGLVKKTAKHGRAAESLRFCPDFPCLPHGNP
jgi:hypothetical protein